MKKWGITPNMEVGQAIKVWKYVCRGGFLPPENILSHHFEKYLYDMDLKLYRTC